MFEQNSRYHNLKDQTYTDESGIEIMYKSRRILAQSDLIPSMVNITVKRNQRLDQISAQTLGNPQYFWKIADANTTLETRDLEQPGIELRIPLDGSRQ